MATNKHSEKQGTVISLLCGPNWRWDTYSNCWISFNKDGTGLIEASADQPVYLASEFEWKLKNPDSLDTVVELDHNNSREGVLLSQFDIELTLTKRLHPRYQDNPIYAGINERFLQDAAFLPKSYTIRLEHGRFDDPAYKNWSIWKNSRPFFYQPDMYALRLVFDKSPFPPLDEWRDARDVAEAGRWPEIKEFVDRNIPTDSWLTVLLRKVTNS